MPGQRWIDVGCGNGVFTEQLIRRCAPSEVQGIDPSEGQLVYARTRSGAERAVFQQGNAMALPFETDRFDVAVMALVISFVPDPAKCVAEMKRVVRPGGVVATYMWDQFGGGAPIEPFAAELRAMGITPTLAPSVHASRMETLRDLWSEAGLEPIETRTIPVQRSYESYDALWEANTTTGVLRATLDRMDAEPIAALKERVRARLQADDKGRIAIDACANAIKGRVIQPA